MASMNWAKTTARQYEKHLKFGTGEFPAQMASNAENVSIWWRHHARAYFFSDEH